MTDTPEPEAIPFNRDDDYKLPLELLNALVEHSPRLVLDRNTLIPFAASPTGWLYLTFKDAP